jgi:peptidyl-prolyl cis-trans isomerase SurA
MHKIIVTALSVLLIAGTALTAEREVVDRIVAVVGDEVILGSELASQVQWQVFQSEKQPRTQSELEELQKQIIEEMVSDRLFLIAAKQDTTIELRKEEIEAALSERIAAVVENFPSHDAFLAALEAEGLTLRDLRRRFRSEVQNQLLKQRFIQRKLWDVSISRHEVEQFYKEFEDSLPSQPEAVKLAHILLSVAPSSEAEDSVRARAKELRSKILGGADFATISARHSSMGAGAGGGDLGYVSREDVVDEFARAAFNLQVGDISGVVRTQYGFHIIKCEDIRGEERHLRHLLLAVEPTAQDTARVMGLADSLMTAIRQGADFEETAKIFSADDDTRAEGGELGWFAIENMPPEFQEAVVGWDTPGELRGPVKTQFGIHILKLLDYQPPKEFTLEDDYDRIKELARQDKTGEMVDEWIEELKDETYIRYYLDI